MPYQSPEQAAYLHIHEPELAARWDRKYYKGKRKRVAKKAYERRSDFDSYEPQHRQTTFQTPTGRTYNVDRKMKRTVQAMNRGGIDTFASDQGDFRIRDSRKDAYVAYDETGHYKKLQGLPKRFKHDPPNPYMAQGAVRFRAGPVVGAINRRRLRKQVSKAVIRMPIRRVIDTRVPLGPNEFYHGTTKASAQKIRQEGFKLADPRATTFRGADAARAGSGTKKQRRIFGGASMELRPVQTRAGRPKATGDLGPGVYGTKDPQIAATFGHILSGGSHDSSFGRHLGSYHGDLVRVRVKGQIGPTPHHADPKAGPRATKQGLAALEHNDVDAGGIHQVVIPNPRNAEVVPTTTRLAPGWTYGEYLAAGGVTGFGGVKGTQMVQRHYERDDRGRFYFSKSYDEPLLFMTNLQEIDKAFGPFGRKKKADPWATPNGPRQPQVGVHPEAHRHLRVVNPAYAAHLENRAASAAKAHKVVRMRKIGTRAGAATALVGAGAAGGVAAERLRVKKNDEPLMFMTNLNEISKSNPDSSDVHVLGTLRVYRPRRHGRAKDKKVTTWS